MSGKSSRAAFFDVDETVITAKSMLSFLYHWSNRTGAGPAAYHEAVDQLHALAAAGADRSEANRSYYRRFAGVSYSHLLNEGRAWYADYRRRPDAFVTATIEAIRRHRDADVTVVLVSGSFRPCLEPLAEEIRADLVLGTEPLVGPHGLLTGEVVRPMIGEMKALAVVETIDALGLDADQCAAYGDHISDLDMLLKVGRPHVVGNDSVLAQHARRHGWPLLSAASGPGPQDVHPGPLS